MFNNSIYTVIYKVGQKQFACTGLTFDTLKLVKRIFKNSDIKFSIFSLDISLNKECGL